ncbi:MAG: hypothetical protein L6Q71_04630 [Planctomycetes bacterium]|nr:hypothetical protein [Planctomycetota bacterium]
MSYTRTRKFKLLQPMLLCLLAFLGGTAQSCASSNPGEDTYRLPASYEDTIDDIRLRAVKIDDLVGGSRFTPAEIEARVLLNLAHHLKTLKPSRELIDLYDYENYQNTVDEMEISANWLLYYIRQHRRVDAHEFVVRVANDFNMIVAKFGPGGPIPLTRTEIKDMDVPEAYRSVVPEERIYR